LETGIQAPISVVPNTSVPGTLMASLLENDPGSWLGSSDDAVAIGRGWWLS